MTYTAPGLLVPPGKAGYFFCSLCAGDVLAVATSVTYTASSATAYLTLPRISVSVTPGSATVALNGTEQFTATVQNDGTHSGVNWSLTENGMACSPACGTMTPASTGSGMAATYTAPASAPVSPLVQVTATSIEDSTKSAGAPLVLMTSNGALACSIGSGSESLLKGQYAFLLQDIVGSFTADGTGKITGGEADLLGPETVTIDPTQSSYAVAPDRRGCLLLTSTNSTSTPPSFTSSMFWFALGSTNSNSMATAGQIITITSQTTIGANTVPWPRGAGILRLQDPASFTPSQFNGDYVLGFLGRDTQMLLTGSNRVAIGGIITADGFSAISSATFDINDVGTITSNLSSAPAGTFTCCDASGRGALTLGNLRTPVIGFYMVNSGDAFLVGNDNNADAIQGVGEAIAVPSGTTFSQSSLNGISVLRATAESSAAAVVDIATVNADGKAAATVNDNVNNAGTFNSSSTAFNYTVGSNGRVTLTGGNTPPLLYLYGPNQGFLVGTDADVNFGILEAQAAGPFSDASFSGTYVLGTEYPSTSTVTMESGVLSADGKGTATGTVDQSIPASLPQSQNFNFTYTLPTNGVGDVGSNTTAILISGNKLVFINNTSPKPTITVVEK